MKKPLWTITIVGILILILLFTWFYYSNFSIKNSKTFCGQSEHDWLWTDKTTGQDYFKDDVCLDKCAEFCTKIGFKYKQHYELPLDSPELADSCLIHFVSCGCKCV